MTQMRNLVFAVVLFGVLALSSCNSLKQMVKLAEQQDLTVSPSPLEVHGGNVDFDMSANLPVRMLKPGKVYTINTFYQYGEDKTDVGSIEFKEEDYPNANDTEPRVTESFSFAYTPDMEFGDLKIQGVASDPRNGKSVNTAELKVADGIITTSLLVKDVYFPAYAYHGYNNQEELIPTNVAFFFSQGSPALRRSETRSERGEGLTAFIAEKNVTRSVTITGTHSPEGQERINADLSEDRAEAIENFYRRQMRKYDYKGLADSINFVLKDVVEDWAEFRTAIRAYDGITQAQKNEALDIVNGTGSFEEKEKDLQQLSFYKKIFNDLYPDLRNAKTEILTVKEKKSDSEISILAKQVASGAVSADTLSDEELMYAATLTPSMTEKKAIYEAATKKSDSWSSHNNLGAIYLQMAAESKSMSEKNSNVEAAMAQLEIAAKQKATVEVHNNLAVANLMQGNNEKAMEHISKAVSIGSGNPTIVQGSNSVKAVLEIKAGDYTNAVSSANRGLDNATNLFNKGLAYLLKKEYQNAVTAFDQAVDENEDFALANYCAAIASVRNGQTADAAEYILKAVKSDPNLKDKAVKDLEFTNVRNNPAFQAALK